MICKKRPLTIVIGADHRGFAHKEFLKRAGSIAGIDLRWHDVGAFDDQRSDYPFFARSACAELLAGRADFGVLICATGVGMAIAANRFKGIYAASVWNSEVARLSREDDNVNVLVIPSDFVSKEQSIALIGGWLCARFKGGRYQERVAMLDTF